MIAFDVQALQSSAFGGRGIGRYVSDLAETLAADHPDAVDVFVWNDRLPWSERLGELAVGDRLRRASEVRGRVDLWHVNAPFEDLPWSQVAPPFEFDRLVVTCYDLIPYRFHDMYLRDRRAAARYRTRLGLLASADLVVTDSDCAAGDLTQLVGISPARIRTIGAGTSARFQPSERSRADVSAEARTEVPALAESFIMVPAGMDPRKNLEGALEAYSRLPAELIDRHQLAVVCDLNDSEAIRLRSYAGSLGIIDAVVFTGHVSDSTLVALYRAAELVFFPSKYEGFGLPVLEARRCGARTICSGVSSLPEVLPDPAAHFDPWSVDDMTTTLARALTDTTFQARLDAIRDPGVSWRSTARALVTSYEELSPARTTAA